MLMEERIGKIDALEIIGISLPLLKPFKTSFGVKKEKTALLLKLQSQGCIGWGECIASPDPFYSYETVETVRHMLRDFLVPLLRDSSTLGEVLSGFKRVRGHPMAKATLENALLDLISRRKDLPVHALFHVEKRKIPAGVSLGIQQEVEELLNLIEWAVERGYRKIKLKIMKGKDVAVLEAVRKRFPDAPFMVDANGDYTSEEFGILKQLDAFELMMIEQPLAYDDLYQHACLQKELKTPLCLDESIESLSDAQAAIALGSCRIINIKQGRVGGLIESSRIADYSRQHGIGVWSGAVIETGIGRAFNMHLQMLPGFVFPGDNSGTVRAFVEDLVEPQVVLGNDGTIELPEGSGIAFHVLEDRVDRYCTFREKL